MKAATRVPVRVDGAQRTAIITGPVRARPSRQNASAHRTTKGFLCHRCQLCLPSARSTISRHAQGTPHLDRLLVMVVITKMVEGRGASVRSWKGWASTQVGALVLLWHRIIGHGQWATQLPCQTWGLRDQATSFNFGSRISVVTALVCDLEQRHHQMFRLTTHAHRRGRRIRTRLLSI